LSPGAPFGCLPKKCYADDMNFLEPHDQDLIRVAQSHIMAHYDPERHTVAAALRAANGKIYTGLSFKYHSRESSMCSERLAVFKAVEDVSLPLDVVVVLKYIPEEASFEFLTPCGLCRQVLKYHQPIDLIYPVDGELVRLSIDELLPYAYV
jgi:cytidine deaminase